MGVILKDGRIFKVILDSAENDFKRKTKEALYIKKIRPTLNSNRGITVKVLTNIKLKFPF